MQLPASFVDYTRALLGEAEYNRFSAALLEDKQPVSIRLNPQKFGRSSFFTLYPSLKEVLWATDAYYLDRRLTFTFDPLFHAGGYYVQEASSMFVEQAVRRYLPDRAVAALDLCAAPGGKSTHLRSLLPEGSLLVANEVMRNRVQVLAENLTKWGHPDVVVTNSDPAEFTPLEHLFDCIHPDRCALLGRRHVPQGRDGHRGMESGECGNLLAAPASHPDGHLALPEAGRTVGIQHVYL